MATECLTCSYICFCIYIKQCRRYAVFECIVNVNEKKSLLIRVLSLSLAAVVVYLTSSSVILVQAQSGCGDQSAGSVSMIILSPEGEMKPNKNIRSPKFSIPRFDQVQFRAGEGKILSCNYRNALKHSNVDLNFNKIKVNQWKVRKLFKAKPVLPLAVEELERKYKIISILSFMSNDDINGSEWLFVIHEYNCPWPFASYETFLVNHQRNN